jgi:DNA-binding response OmpR family regulator
MSDPPAPTAQLRTILVVEDDRSIREMIARALGRRFRIIEAADGLHASELLKQMPVPALMISDVMMPRLDGFSLARLIRANEKLKSLPILFLTAKTSPSDVLQGVSLGARHYMPKPFKLAELVDRVEKLVT